MAATALKNETDITSLESVKHKFVLALKGSLVGGAGLGMALQTFKTGVLDTPALYGRIIHTTFPLCGMAFLYTTTSFIAQRIRKKDDVLNNLIGLFSTTPVIRKFFSLSLTIPILAVGGFITTAVTCLIDYDEIKQLIHEEKYPRNLYPLDFPIWMLQKPSGEPYVKYNP